jgi:predicted nuclease of restriction endonuclease-like (RecB) superfamily
MLNDLEISIDVNPYSRTIESHAQHKHNLKKLKSDLVDKNLTKRLPKPRHKNY